MAESLYEGAKSRWDDRYADLAVGKRNWQIAFAGALIVAAVGIGTAYRLAGQQRVVPYVIEVDKLGQGLAIAPQLTADDVTVDEKRAAIANFIRNARSVEPNVEMMRHYHYNAAYAFVLGPAIGVLDDYEHDNNPFDLAEHLAREVSINYVMQIADAPGTFEADWTETDYDLHGVLVDPEHPSVHYHARIATTVQPPTETTTVADGYLLNPWGIFITSISWEKVLDTANAN